MPPIAIAAPAPTARVSVAGHDHEHQESGQHSLVDEGAAGTDAGHGRPKRSRPVTARSDHPFPHGILDSHRLAEAGHTHLVWLNLGLSLLAGFAAVALGHWLGGAL